MPSAGAKRGTRRGSAFSAGSPSSRRSTARRTAGAASGSSTCASSRPGARGCLSSSAPAARQGAKRGVRLGGLTSARRTEIFPDEAEHRLVPGDGVARLEDPVVLVGEDEQLARHLVVLQRLEEIQPFVD